MNTTGPWAIELRPAFSTHQPFPTTYYAGYTTKPLPEAATTTDPAAAPTWASREAAQKVASTLLPTLSCVWEVVVFPLQLPVPEHSTTEEEALRQMSNACVRAARSADHYADKLIRKRDMSACFYEVDAVNLRAAATLLGAMGRVTALDDERSFEEEVGRMAPDELRRRVLAQAGHIRAYARCLDGLGVEEGVERLRDANILRRAYLKVASGGRLPAEMTPRQLVSLCLSLVPGYEKAGEGERRAIETNLRSWFAALRRELLNPSSDPRVDTALERVPVDNPF